MSIIFLDIDGVLVTRRTASRNKADFQCVLALNKILKETGADIVLVSSWRYKPIAEMIDIFEGWGIERVDGFDYAPHISLTSEKIVEFLREHEVAAWIAANDVYSFVILDDNGNHYPTLKDYLIIPTFERGLTMDHAQEAIEILNG
jgi:hypothetical protein